MALARFKDLVLDAGDAALLGRFWATVLGLDFESLDDGDAKLTGPTPRHTIWVNAVPEARTVKNRMHLDVHAESIADLEALGATVNIRSAQQPWVVMADPEGGEFCAFVRPERHDYRLYEVVLDSTDPDATAGWWAQVLGVPVHEDDSEPWRWLEDIPGAPFDSLVFPPVPEPKTAKNRLHLDVQTDDLEALVAAGATVLRPEGDGGIGWSVLADPDGNEFCAFT